MPEDTKTTEEIINYFFEKGARLGAKDLIWVKSIIKSVEQKAILAERSRIRKEVEGMKDTFTITQDMDSKMDYIKHRIGIRDGRNDIIYEVLALLEGE